MQTRRTLQLSETEVEAVIHYIWQHTRSSPNGKGYKVWQRMLEFQNGEEIKQQRHEQVIYQETLF